MFFILLILAQLKSKVFVRSSKLFENLTNCSPDSLGKNSLNSLIIGFTILSKALKQFVSPLSIACLPPFSFQNLSISLRASAIGPTILSNPWLIDVNNSAASSLLPMMCSHDTDHPDCTLSFMVSTKAVNVFTCVAACNNDGSLANFCKVANKISLVNHPLPSCELMESLND